MDHSALLYLVNKQALIGRLARWMLLLQEFEFDISNRPRVQYAVTDYLSWLESEKPTETIYDDLLDANLFDIDAPTPHTEIEDE